jgi:Rrf2 family transcriptional regulator, cysteine metabolism repressor
MRISTKGRYALEAILEIAVSAGTDGQVNMKKIASNSGISENYLEQLFILLRRRDIIESARGATGGYRLARPAEDITAGEVIRAAEGSLAPVACVDEENCLKICGRSGDCSTRGLWKQMADVINKTADSVTIGDLAACHKAMLQPDVIEFFI